MTGRAVDLAAAPAFRRDVAALHELGARATAELIAELILEIPADRRLEAEALLRKFARRLHA